MSSEKPYKRNKPGLHVSRKDPKHMFAKHIF